ncbi:MAG: 16S rRNA (adenine(1518)-N(6)/adenine(1519)-N(6))-dimethyltransferase RsmA [Litorivicinus sp.]
MNHKARKRFGQNFLTDQRVLDQIQAAIGIRPGQHLVEVGPGLGALTRRLTAADCLTLIELDRDLAAGLRGDYGEQVVEGDALFVDLDAIAARSELDLRLVGNLPYNVGTALVLRFLAWGGARDMTFMLQKEVVQRLCAQVGDRHYGRLAIVTACYARAEYLFDVPPTAFDPPPKVDSAIVRLTPIDDPGFSVTSMDKLEQVTQAAFSQRRKTLRNSLKLLLDHATLEGLGIDPSQRAETLSPLEFARISNHLSAHD